MTPERAKTAFLLVLAVTGALFALFWLRALRASSEQKDKESWRPTAYELFVGVLTDFFDTLGIGSFALTTALYRAKKTVPDRLLPGTLNVGHALPTFVQALIYVSLVEVDLGTLVSMIASATLGGYLGARVVSRLPRRPIQIGLALALALAAALLGVKMLDQFPPGGGALGLTGAPLVFACAANFVLGALMTLGLGLYGPCMILVSLLGMNPLVAFPIMMGSCALLMTAASARFVATESYSRKAAIGLTIGGVPAVIFAARVVRSLPLRQVRWLVLFVVLYTAMTMLRDAAKKEAA